MKLSIVICIFLFSLTLAAFPPEWTAQNDKELQQSKDVAWILKFEKELQDLIYDTDPDHENKRVVNLRPWLEWPSRYEKQRYEWQRYRSAFQGAKNKVMTDLQMRGFHVYTIDMEVHLNGDVIPQTYWMISRRTTITQ